MEKPISIYNMQILILLYTEVNGPSLCDTKTSLGDARYTCYRYPIYLFGILLYL